MSEKERFCQRRRKRIIGEASFAAVMSARRCSLAHQADPSFARAWIIQA